MQRAGECTPRGQNRRRQRGPGGDDDTRGERRRTQAAFGHDREIRIQRPDVGGVGRRATQHPQQIAGGRNPRIGSNRRQPGRLPHQRRDRNRQSPNQIAGIGIVRLDGNRDAHALEQRTASGLRQPGRQGLVSSGPSLASASAIPARVKRSPANPFHSSATVPSKPHCATSVGRSCPRTQTMPLVGSVWLGIVSAATTPSRPPTIRFSPVFQ